MRKENKKLVTVAVSLKEFETIKKRHVNVNTVVRLCIAECFNKYAEAFNKLDYNQQCELKNYLSNLDYVNTEVMRDIITKFEEISK